MYPVITITWVAATPYNFQGFLLFMGLIFCFVFVIFLGMQK